jgi:hypothetical protein
LGDIVNIKEENRFRTSPRHRGTEWFLTICGIKKLMPFRKLARITKKPAKIKYGTGVWGWFSWTAPPLGERGGHPPRFVKILKR